MDEQVKFSLSDDDIVIQINKWLKDAKEGSAEWRKEASECHAFVAGHQWSEDDIMKLEKENRPNITFNWVGPMIAAILGMEANQRNEMRFQPREVTDTALADGLNSVCKALRDMASIDEEETDAFEDLVISGMGWTDTRMDYDEDLDGKFMQESIDSQEMFWDPTATKPNLRDRGWQIHAKKMHRKDILLQWPDAEIPISAESDILQDVLMEPVDVTGTDRYGTKGTGDSHEGTKDKRMDVLRCQWFEFEPVYRMQHPVTKQIITLGEKEHGELKETIKGLGINIVKQNKKKFYEAYTCGKVLLEKKLAPSQYKFTYTCMTGKRDRKKKCFYGIVRPMIDPQRWSNKFFSQILDIINSNAKGGIIAEQDTFVDPRKAENDWAKADSIIYTKRGSVPQNKIMPKPQAQYPTGLDKLMQFSISSIRGVSGINLEMLGQADREQAGVVEDMRKQSAFTIIAKVFESLKAYRKDAGCLVIDFINQYIPMTKIASVLGPAEQQYAPIIKNTKPDMVDIIVSEAATSENNKHLVWTFFMQVLPMMMKAGMPIPPSLLDYSPLPASIVAEWKQSMVPSAPGGPPGPPGASPPQGGPNMNASQTGGSNAR